MANLACDFCLHQFAFSNYGWFCTSALVRLCNLYESRDNHSRVLHQMLCEAQQIFHWGSWNVSSDSGWICFSLNSGFRLIRTFQGSSSVSSRWWASTCADLQQNIWKWREKKGHHRTSHHLSQQLLILNNGKMKRECVSMIASEHYSWKCYRRRWSPYLNNI